MSFGSSGRGEGIGGGLPEGLPESMRVVRVVVEGCELTPESRRMLSIDGGTGGGMTVECEYGTERDTERERKKEGKEEKERGRVPGEVYVGGSGGEGSRRKKMASGEDRAVALTREWR